MTLVAPGFSRKAPAALLVLLLATPAHADWVVAAYLGAATTRPAKVTIVQPARATTLTLGPLDYRGESFRPPVYYGYRIAYFPIATFGLEAEFVHLKAFADTSAIATMRGTHRGAPIDGRQPVSDVVQAFSISHGVNLLLANAVFRWPIGNGWPVAVVARAGAGGSVPHPESAIDGRQHEGYEFGAMSAQLAAGVEAHVARGLHALVEYKFTRSRQSVTVADGTADTLLRTHHVVFGAGYRF